MSLQPTISITADLLDQNRAIININGQNLPSNLFGAAFHFRLETEKWDCKKIHAGSVFAAQEPELMVLSAMRESPQKELIIGMSLRQGSKLQAHDGTIISLSCSAPNLMNLPYYFGSGVLSIYDNGRKDLTDIVWKEGVLSQEKSSPQSAQIKNPAPLFLEKNLQAQVLTTSYPPPFILPRMTVRQNFALTEFLLAITAVLIIGLLFLVFRKR